MYSSIGSFTRRGLEKIPWKISLSTVGGIFSQRHGITSSFSSKETDERYQGSKTLCGNRTPPLGDRLILRGLRFHGRHGVFEEERKMGQKFEIDLDVWLDLRKAGETDELQHSVNYAEIYGRVKAIVEGPAHFLVESVATAIAVDVLGQFPQISDVRVRVGKPHVAVDGPVDLVGVEIFRSSSQFTEKKFEFPQD